MARMTWKGRRYVSRKRVLARYDISAPTLWRWCQDGKFPAPLTVQDGQGRVLRWRVRDLMAWERERGMR